MPSTAAGSTPAMSVRDPDGFLRIIDRKKDMIITGGFNVYPREIEDVISEHPAVAQVAVIGVPHEKWGEAVKAFIVLKPGTEFEELAANQLDGATQASLAIVDGAIFLRTDKFLYRIEK